RHQFALGDNVSSTIGRDAVFIDVVACMYPQIEVVPLRCVGVGVEPAYRNVRAGENTQAEGGDIANRQCPGAADGGHAAVRCHEAIPVGGSWLQPVDADLGRPVAPCTRVYAATCNHMTEVAVFGNLDFQVGDLGVGRGDVACPQQH